MKAIIFKPITFNTTEIDADNSISEFTVEPNEFGLYKIGSISKEFYSNLYFGKELGHILRPSNWKTKEKNVIMDELARNDEEYNNLFVFNEAGNITCVNNYLAKKYYEWCIKEIKEWLVDHPPKNNSDVNDIKIENVELTLEEKITKVKTKINKLINIYVELRVEQEKTQPKVETCQEDFYAVGHYWNKIKGQENKLKREARLKAGKIANSLAEMNGWQTQIKYDKNDNKYNVYPESKLRENFDKIFNTITFEDLEKSEY